ncbi:MAG: gamma-glutamyltransferase, partial [Alphaproteobacteria bacterium]
MVEGHSKNLAPANLSRPEIMATRHAVSSGHYWSSQAAMQILEAGGNAIDAGVAAGIATNVLESQFTGFAGVAPTMIYLAKEDRVLTISGVGPWPKAASCNYFHKHHGGRVPVGLLNTVVPSTPAIWILALEKYGTMSFGDVAAAGIRFARDGFPMYPLFRDR